jgi:cytochrome c-type biogenesis protein
VSEYVTAFTLGNAAILTNVCVLPLYPGLVALLAGRSESAGPRSGWWLGVPVLGGLITFMIAIGFVLHQAQRSVASVLDWLLPLLYLAVAALGGTLVAGRNPFTRLAGVHAPVLRNPAATAFLYGMLLAPMTLPCAGPLVVSAFVIGGVSGSGALADSLTYFAAFALGFGWPMLLLPLLAEPLRRRATRLTARHHRVIGAASGVLLIGIAVLGWWTEVRPN